MDNYIHVCGSKHNINISISTEAHRVHLVQGFASGQITRGQRRDPAKIFVQYADMQKRVLYQISASYTGKLLILTS